MDYSCMVSTQFIITFSIILIKKHNALHHTRTWNQVGAKLQICFKWDETENKMEHFYFHEKRISHLIPLSNMDGWMYKEVEK